MSDIVLVLGMDDAGAGCLAACLRACGLWLGPVADDDPQAARGRGELELAVSVNAAILHDAGGSRLRPPGTTHARPAHRRRIRELAALLEERLPCGVKDPQLLLVLEDWRSTVADAGAGAGCVASFRAPGAVVASLSRREGLSRQQAVDLWVRYHDALVSAHRRRPFPLIEHDPLDRARYARTVAAAARELGLTPDIDALAAIVDAEPDGAATTPGAAPECEAILEYLREHRVRA